MAGSFSDYLEDKVLKHVFTNTAYTAPSTVYVALFTVAPSDTGGGTEVSTSGTAYARQSMAFTVSGTNPSQAVNTAAVEWPTATASWGTVVAAAAYDASSGGNMLAWADLASNKTIASGDVFRFPASSFAVTLA
jgi:hypothetical protein